MVGLQTKEFAGLFYVRIVPPTLLAWVSHPERNEGSFLLLAMLSTWLMECRGLLCGRLLKWLADWCDGMLFSLHCMQAFHTPNPAISDGVGELSRIIMRSTQFLGHRGRRCRVWVGQFCTERSPAQTRVLALHHHRCWRFGFAIAACVCSALIALPLHGPL